MNATVTAAAIGVGGSVIVAVVAFWATVRNTNKLTKQTEQGQLTDRFTKAVEQLGSDKLDVRIGGIYALERVACDSPQDHPTVMEVLTAFVREHSRISSRQPRPGMQTGRWFSHRRKPSGAVSGQSPRPDVQAALTVVGRLTALERGNPKRHIRPIDLIGAKLADAKLPHDAYLVEAKLADADLTSVDLTSVDLTDADLTGAKRASEDAPIPGWVRDPHSGLLSRASEPTGDAGS